MVSEELLAVLAVVEKKTAALSAVGQPMPAVKEQPASAAEPAVEQPKTAAAEEQSAPAAEPAVERPTEAAEPAVERPTEAAEEQPPALEVEPVVERPKEAAGLWHDDARHERASRPWELPCKKCGLLLRLSDDGLCGDCIDGRLACLAKPAAVEQSTAASAEPPTPPTPEPAPPEELDAAGLAAMTLKEEIVAEYLAQDRAAVTVTKMNLLRNEMQLRQTALDGRVQSATDAALAVSSLAQDCSLVYGKQRLAQAAALQALHSLACSTSRVEALGSSAAQVSAEATVAKFRQFHLQKTALDKALRLPQSDLTPLEDQLFAVMSEASGTSKRAAALSAAAACATCAQLAGQRVALSALAQLDALRRDASAKYELFAEFSEQLAALHRGIQSDLDEALVAMQRSIESVTSLSGGDAEGESHPDEVAVSTVSSYSLLQWPRPQSHAEA
jgi:hypothetical protein